MATLFSRKVNLLGESARREVDESGIRPGLGERSVGKVAGRPGLSLSHLIRPASWREGRGTGGRGPSSGPLAQRHFVFTLDRRTDQILTPRSQGCTSEGNPDRTNSRPQARKTGVVPLLTSFLRSGHRRKVPVERVEGIRESSVEESGKIQKDGGLGRKV